MIRAVLRGRVVPLSIVVSLVVCVTLACATPEPAQHLEFVIPEGTAGLIATNRAPEIIPANLVVHVGDSITIINEDDFDQEVGPYRVKAKTKISQHFSSPGVLEGTCKMSSGGSLTVTVLART